MSSWNLKWFPWSCFQLRRRVEEFAALKADVSIWILLLAVWRSDRWASHQSLHAPRFLHCQLICLTQIEPTTTSVFSVAVPNKRGKPDRACRRRAEERVCGGAVLLSVCSHGRLGSSICVSCSVSRFLCLRRSAAAAAVLCSSLSVLHVESVRRNMINTTAWPWNDVLMGGVTCGSWLCVIFRRNSRTTIRLLQYSRRRSLTQISSHGEERTLESLSHD